MSGFTFRGFASIPRPILCIRPALLEHLCNCAATSDATIPRWHRHSSRMRNVCSSDVILTTATTPLIVKCRPVSSYSAVLSSWKPGAESHFYTCSGNISPVRPGQHLFRLCSWNKYSSRLTVFISPLAAVIHVIHNGGSILDVLTVCLKNCGV